MLDRAPALLKLGVYRNITDDLEYTIHLKKDSTFDYTIRYEWPVEFTHGTWRIDRKTLVLNSVNDTAISTPGVQIGKYIMLFNQRFEIKKNKLVEIDRARMKYKFVGTE